jgi:hypothetical protein
MRTISQKDLNREKRRKGVSVIRKLGSQPEKPEPEVNGSQSLSGETTQAEAVPAPASEFYSLMGKMTEIMERLSGAENEEKPKEEGTQETKPEEVLRPFQLVKGLPKIPLRFAEVGDKTSYDNGHNHTLLGDGSTSEDQDHQHTWTPDSDRTSYDNNHDHGVVAVTTAVAEVEAAQIPKPSNDWDHVMRRDRGGLMMQIISIDKAGNQWTHDFARAGTKFIIEILSKSNTGLRFMHKFHRDDETKLIDTATTRAEA